jgi:hypothetical protein
VSRVTRPREYQARFGVHSRSIRVLPLATMLAPHPLHFLYRSRSFTIQTAGSASGAGMRTTFHG